jgi:type IV pilus assembly protein PilM
MRSSRILAIDIGASHVACGVFSTGPTGRLVLRQFAWEPCNSGSSPEARWAADVAQSLGVIVARQRRARRAALSVPGHLALTKFVRTPSVAEEKRDRMVAFEASENIPYPLEEIVWDYRVMSDDGVDLEVMLVAAKLDAIQALCASTDSAGIPVECAIPAGLALWHAFRHSHPGLHEPAVVAGIGARSTHLLFAGGERFHVRTLPFAGNAVTQGIADELGIDFASAEALKIGILSGHSDLPATARERAAVQRATAAFACKLHLEITRSLLNHRRNAGAEVPAALYLTGGGGLIPELPGTLAEKLRMRVERFDPLRCLDLSADARAAGADAFAPRLAELVGLASRVIDGDAHAPSLLPPAASAAIALRRRRPWHIASAALVAAALLPPITYFHRQATGHEAAIARIDGALMPMRSLQARNSENLRQVEDVRKQIAALRTACGARVNWLALLSDLQGRLARIEDAWLDTLEVIRLAHAESGTPHSGMDATPDATSVAGAVPPAYLPRLALSGRLLDVANPRSKVSPQSVARAKRLLASFKDSPFVATVESEHFDTTRNGLLRFDFTLVLNPAKPL